METKELTNVPGLEPSDVVLIRKLGPNSMTKLRSKVMLIKNDKQGNVTSHSDTGLYQKWLFLYGVVEAPFFKKLWEIEKKEEIFKEDEIDLGAFDFICIELEKLNAPKELLNKKKD